MRFYSWLILAFSALTLLSCLEEKDVSLNPQDEEVGFINLTDNIFLVSIPDAGVSRFLATERSKGTLPFIRGYTYIVYNQSANNKIEVFPSSGGITYEIYASNNKWSVRRR